MLPAGPGCPKAWNILCMDHHFWAANMVGCAGIAWEYIRVVLHGPNSSDRPDLTGLFQVGSPRCNELMILVELSPLFSHTNGAGNRNRGWTIIRHWIPTILDDRAVTSIICQSTANRSLQSSFLGHVYRWSASYHPPAEHLMDRKQQHHQFTIGVIMRVDFSLCIDDGMANRED